MEKHTKQRKNSYCRHHWKSKALPLNYISAIIVATTSLTHYHLSVECNFCRWALFQASQAVLATWVCWVPWLDKKSLICLKAVYMYTCKSSTILAFVAAANLQLSKSGQALKAGSLLPRILYTSFFFVPRRFFCLSFPTFFFCLAFTGLHFGGKSFCQRIAKLFWRKCHHLLSYQVRSGLKHRQQKFEPLLTGHRLNSHPLLGSK